MGYPRSAPPWALHLSPRCSAVSVCSPAARREHRGSCGQCGEPGRTQVLPREGCKDGCYFEGKTELQPPLSVTCHISSLSNAFSGLRVAHPLSPPQPLCYRRRGSRSSPRCRCPPGSPSFLQLHRSMCRDCGRITRAMGTWIAMSEKDGVTSSKAVWWLFL